MSKRKAHVDKRISSPVPGVMIQAFFGDDRTTFKALQEATRILERKSSGPVGLGILRNSLASRSSSYNPKRILPDIRSHQCSLLYLKTSSVKPDLHNVCLLNEMFE